MRKTILVLCSLALLASGCDKVATVEEPAKDSSRHLTVDIKVDFAAETRSMKTGWEAGDVIYVAFDHFFTSESNITKGSPQPAYYMTLTYDGTSWNSAFSDDALEDYLLNQTSGSLAAGYCSTMSDTRLKYSYSSVMSFSRLEPAVYPDSPGFFLHAYNVTYEVTDRKLTATLPMKVEEASVYFYIDGIPASDVSRYSLKEKSEHLAYFRFSSFIVNKMSNGSWNIPSVNHPTTNIWPIPATGIDGGAFFCAGIFHKDVIDKETEYVIQITDNMGTPADDSDDMVYSLTRTATLHGKEAFTLPSLDDPRWVVSNVKGTRGSLNGHEWVLMADGNKWATKNLGANREIDGGSMLKWKDIQEFTESKFGKGWRVPTLMDWVHLMLNGNHTYRRVYFKDEEEEDMFSGWEVTVDDGLEMSGNRLFIPAAPYFDETIEMVANYDGHYWSSTLYDETHPNVWHIDHKNHSGVIQDLSIDCLMAVRPIVDERALTVDYQGFKNETEW